MSFTKVPFGITTVPLPITTDGIILFRDSTGGFWTLNISSGGSGTYQPLNSNLTSISSIAMTAYGEGFLSLAGPSSARTYLGIPSSFGTVTAVTMTLQDGITGYITNASTAPNLTLGLGDITPDSVDSAGNIWLDGDLIFSGTSQRIRGNFTDLPRSIRPTFISSVVNGATVVGAIPNGTNTLSGWRASNASDQDNCGTIVFAADSPVHRISSTKRGTGTTLPIALQIDDISRAVLLTNGDWLMTPTTITWAGWSAVAGRGIYVQRDGVAGIQLLATSGSSSSIFGSAAGGTIGGGLTATAIGAGTIIGAGAYDGTNWFTGARIQMMTSQSPTGAARGHYISFDTILHGATSLSERMRLSQAGNLLIGTTTDPAAASSIVAVGTGSVARLGVGVAADANNIIEAVGQVAASRKIAGFKYYANDNNGALVGLRKGRGTYSVPLALNSGDELASLNFEGIFNSAAPNDTTGASISAATTESWTGTTTLGAYMAFKTVLTGATTLAERMRISGAGNLLIGTTSDTGLTGSGGLKLASSTASSSSSTGSFVTAGGIGVGGNSVFGGVVGVGTLDANVSFNINRAFSAGAYGYHLAIQGTITATVDSSDLIQLYIDPKYAKNGHTGMTAYGLKIGPGLATGTGTLGAAYSLYIDSPAVASGQRYALYVNGDSVLSTATLGSTTISGSFKPKVNSVDGLGSTTLSDTDFVVYFTSASPFNYTMLAASSYANMFVILKNIGAGSVTVDATGLGQFFTTALVNTIVLATGDSITVVSNGTTWMVV